MKFISAEEFLKQDKKVQEVFINWWEPGIGDLFTYKEKDEHDYIEVECIQSKNRLRTISFAEIIPLLTEGQLRKFIEDKTGCYIDISHNSMDTCIQLCDKENEYPIGEWEWQYLSNDLLQAYWKVAVEIAEHETR